MNWLGIEAEATSSCAAHKLSQSDKNWTAWKELVPPYSRHGSVRLDGSKVSSLDNKHAYAGSNIATVVIATVFIPSVALGWPCAPFACFLKRWVIVGSSGDNARAKRLPQQSHPSSWREFRHERVGAQTPYGSQRELCHNPR